MTHIDTLISDLDETIHASEYGANIGGAPCGALWVVVLIWEA